MLCEEIIAVSESHTKHINVSCEQNIEYPNVKPVGTYSNRGAGSSVGIATDYGLDGSGSNPDGN